MAYQRIDPASRVYQEFARLYSVARAMRPSNHDGWNGELYSRDDDVWGSVNPKSGAISLNARQVLPYLTGAPSPSHRAEQTQALQTVLHEAYHQGVETDAPNERNAFRGYESKALDEGLTEFQASRRVTAFARQAGYGHHVSQQHAYPGAYVATTELLDYAVDQPQDRAPLAQRALDQPVVMRWDTIADEIVRNKLANVVPSDPHHQQAARGALVTAMAHQGWHGLQDVDKVAGELAARHTTARLDNAINDISRHYRDSPHEVYPASPPNTAFAPRDHDQSQAPVKGPSAQTRQAVDPAMRAAFGGQAPASGAIQNAPSLGNGARGAGRNIPSHGLTPRGRDDR